MKQLYQEKRREYFSSVRPEILPLVPAATGRALDIGCGEGATLNWLKTIGRCRETWGVEFMEPAAEVARRVLDRVIVGNIETDTFGFDEGQFDLILCLDVLEHLRDPWETLKRVCAWLSPGGVAIVSLPNIRYLKVLTDLVLKGEFTYEEMGILDRTHLRFFTRKSAIRLLESAKLSHIQLTLHPSVIRGKRALVNAMLLGRFRDIFSWQLLLRGTKAV